MPAGLSERIMTAMTRTASPRILLVASPRSNSALGPAPLRRYRLVRVRAGARPEAVAAPPPAGTRR